MGRGTRLKFPSVTGFARKTCGRSAVGSASPCQGEGRGFESRRPLGGRQTLRRHVGGVAERRGNGLQSRVHGFKSRLHLGFREARDILCCTCGRLAQWERASLTRKRSLVQTQYRPPVLPGQRLVTKSWVTSRSLFLPDGVIPALSTGRPPSRPRPGRLRVVGAVGRPPADLPCGEDLVSRCAGDPPRRAGRPRCAPCEPARRRCGARSPSRCRGAPARPGRSPCSPPAARRAGSPRARPR